MEPLRALSARSARLPTPETIRTPDMPPVFVLALGALGAAALVRILARESRRVNAELDAQRRVEEATQGDRRGTLRRDPASGEHRPSDS